MSALRALTPASFVAFGRVLHVLAVLAVLVLATLGGSVSALATASAAEQSAPSACTSAHDTSAAKHASFSAPPATDPSSGASLFDADDQLDDEDDDESGELEAHVLGAAAQARESAPVLGFGRDVVSSRELAAGLERPPRA